MNYAIIHDDQVTRVVNSDSDVTALKVLYGADDVRPVPPEYTFTGCVRSVDWDTYTLKALSARVAEGLVEVPEGSILDGETIREMTVVERIEAGLDAVPSGLKITDGKLVRMSRDERYGAGQLPLDEYNAEVRAERQYRYTTESDPLRAEWQYDAEIGAPGAAVKRQAWLDKVAEIKADLPLIETGNARRPCR